MQKEIYFAGGCFWGVEHFFKGVDGVRSATPGYANGNIESPTYQQVYTDTTGFAETVKVCYNPDRISLQRLVRLYFTIIDPASLNKQGHDEGTRYRTGIFYSDASELPLLEAEMDRLRAACQEPVVVELEPLRNFYPAEEYHQNYLDKNPGGYCHLDIKAFAYLRMYQDLALIIEGETDQIARMAEAAALIQERLHFFWTGFYRVQGDQLVLGPFQGPSACLRIGYGKGVCGTAWKQARTIVVPDVEEFPGHIACSSLSRSEIVVPVLKDGQVTAVLDIDSTEVGTFDRLDAAFLELVTQLI